MGVEFGKYELVKRLAAGGMGEVYLARPLGTEGWDELVVVKTLLRTLSDVPEFLTMFLDEAKLAVRLDHPNVCRIFESGEHDGSYYLAMEYIRGEDLRRLERAAHAQGLELPVEFLVKAVAEAGKGLGYAHELKDDEGKPFHLVHRDVSPQNVLVSFAGEVKLIDFGVAKAAGRASHTKTGQLKGKVAYMSPEQAWGKEIDRRSDVFSLGIVLHELLVGRPLFKGDSDLRTLRAVSECAVEPPSKLNERVPESLDPIVLKALAKEPEDRYQTADELSRDLEAWLAREGRAATPADLGAFVAQVLAERVEGEKAHGPLWDVGDRPLTHEPLDLVPGATGAGRRPSTGSQTKSMAASAPPKKSAVPLAIAGAAVLAGIGGVAFAFLGGNPAPATAQIDARPKLTVRSEPSGAEVSLDGKVIGTTPLEELRVEARPEAKLAVAAPGRVPVAQTIALESDFSATYQLEKQKVELAIESEPPGATVRVGAAVIGVTPVRWEAPDGDRVELSFALDGYQERTEPITVAAGLTVRPSLEREKQVRPASAPKQAPTSTGKPPKPAGPVIPTFED